MKKVLVYDVAAEMTGALTVLKYYYDKYANDTTQDTIVVISVIDLKETDHIQVIRLPWTKKSWFHRLYCDCFYIKRFIKTHHVDEVMNLQNIAISGINVPQTVYLHNAIPFSDVDFSFKSEKSLWLYKHIIGKRVIHKLHLADKIIVQADWIKETISERYHIDKNKILVEKIRILAEQQTKRIITEKTVFFYPAIPASYKNHQIIIDACKLLSKRVELGLYEVVFTITQNGSPLAESICRQAIEANIPIKLVGMLDKPQMTEMYRKSVLLFPSILETVGLPILEAKQYNCDIIVSDCKYARETIGDYKNVEWFDPSNAKELSLLMEHYIRNMNEEKTEW